MCILLTNYLLMCKHVSYERKNSLWKLPGLSASRLRSNAGAQQRGPCCWLLIAWLMSTFAGLMGSVLRGMMCLMINFSCMGHVSSVNESVTLMYAQKMTFIFTLGTESESHMGGANGTRMNAISLVHNVMHV